MMDVRFFVDFLKNVMVIFVSVVSAFFIGGAPQLKNKNSLYNSAKVRVGHNVGVRVLRDKGELCVRTQTIRFFLEKKKNEQDERIRISSVPVGTVHLELDVILRHFGAHDISWE